MEHAKNTQQQQGQQQHSTMSHQELNRDWRSDEDVTYRRKIREHIVHILWQLHDLPIEVKRLEQHLYLAASSLEVYNDISTLYQRLNVAPSSSRTRTPLVPLQMQQLPQMQAQQNLIFQHQKTQEQHPTTGTNVVNISQQIQAQSQTQPHHQRNMVNIPDNINPMIMSTTSQTQYVAAPTSGNMQSNSTIIGSSDVIGPQNSRFANVTQNFLSSQSVLTSAPGNGPAISSSSGSRPTGSDRQQVLRHKQQRILILRHAAKCPHEVGRCPVTQHCASMKRLWKHCTECKDPKCLVSHCVSSRYVLIHYKRCKDEMCPMCVPVREEIRCHKKQKQIQRHQAAMQQSQASTSDQARMMSIQESSTTSPEVQSSTSKRRKTVAFRFFQTINISVPW
eukprot:scaffold42325_cov53-Attheya_sp.AAC.2